VKQNKKKVSLLRKEVPSTESILLLLLLLLLLLPSLPSIGRDKRMGGDKGYLPLKRGEE